jgi:signal transduction histidine kinase
VTSPDGAGGRSSVRQYLSGVLLANLLVLLVVGAGGLVATVRAHDSVHYLTEHVAPTVEANAAVLQDLTDAETYVWGWGISGKDTLLQRFRDSVDRYRADERRLERLGDIDPQVALLVDDFTLAADTWFSAYVDKRLAQTTGPASFDADLFERGLRLFDEVRTTNAAVATALQQITRDADDRSHRTEHRLILMLAVLVVLGLVASWYVGRRIGRRVTEPLGALERTANDLAAGHHDARAPVAGPREVVQVASAVNRMASENERAREVESHVVAQLRALDAVKSDFVSNVSHELRTPLTSILGYLELLEEELRGRDDGAEHEMVAAAKRNVVRLGELIDDLLDLTRSEDIRTEMVPTDLGAVVRDIVTDLRVASSQQGIDIRLEVPREPVAVLADAGQIARVVTNLVSNAVKFSQGESEVVVAVLAEGSDAVLKVEDHGIGIPEAELDQLGSRFYRASNAVGLGITGTGLGLRIVQEIVANHGGSVDLRSALGVGTTVWVRIPLADGDGSTAAGDGNT